MILLHFKSNLPNTDSHQVVRVHNETSFSQILSTGVQQGCVLSPLLYTFYIPNFVGTKVTNTIVKF